MFMQLPVLKIVMCKIVIMTNIYVPLLYLTQSSIQYCMFKTNDITYPFCIKLNFKQSFQNYTL